MVAIKMITLKKLRIAFSLEFKAASRRADSFSSECPDWGQNGFLQKGTAFLQKAAL
jgi:hypothetical protein